MFVHRLLLHRRPCFSSPSPSRFLSVSAKSHDSLALSLPPGELHDEWQTKHVCYDFETSQPPSRSVTLVQHKPSRTASRRVQLGLRVPQKQGRVHHLWRSGTTSLSRHRILVPWGGGRVDSLGLVSIHDELSHVSVAFSPLL